MNRLCIAPILSLSLVACGGGGGGGDGVADAGADATPDLTAPTATLTPAAGEEGVERNAAVMVTFSEAMDVSTIDELSITLANESGSVAGTVSYDSATNIASFTPATSLAMLGKYTATIGGSISDLSGNLLAAESISFTVRDGRWSEVGALEDDSSGLGAIKPKVGFFPDGDALAIWSHHNGTGFDIWSNYYSRESGWQTAAKLESSNLGVADRPQLAMDDNGKALAVWKQEDSIWSSRYAQGAGWDTPTLIEMAAQHVENPQVSVNATGDGFAVWRQHDGTRNNIWSNNYIAGEGWGTAILVETDDVANAAGPQIGIADNGNAIATWRQSDGNIVNILANTYIPGEGWGTATQIEAEDANAFVTHIAMNSVGAASVVWRQSDGIGESIWANQYAPGEGWGTAALIETSESGAAGSARVAMHTNGEAIAVWQQSEGTEMKIWSNRYVPTEGWGSASLLGSGEAVYAYAAQVAINGRGDAIVVWVEDEGAIIQTTWSRRYTVANGWENVSELHGNATGYTVDPSIALDADGNALAVWTYYDETRENIAVKRFD